MLSTKRPLTKRSCVVRKNSHSTSSTTQQQGKSNNCTKFSCVSIRLQCWPDKARTEIATWAAVGVARQQQFSHNSVSKFWQCECDRCGFNSHLMRIRGMQIKFAYLYVHYVNPIPVPIILCRPIPVLCNPQNLHLCCIDPIPVLCRPQNLYLYRVDPTPVPVMCIPGPSMSHEQ